MSDYEYDVFLSYRRGQRLVSSGDWPLDRDGEWVHKVLFPEFKHWLDRNPVSFRSKFYRSEFHSMLDRAQPSAARRRGCHHRDVQVRPVPLVFWA